MPPDLSFDNALCSPDALSRPVCVALDGTLISTPLFSERVALLFRQRPWLALVLPFRVLGGPERLKRRVARSSTLDPLFLPYRRALLTELAACRKAGRQVILTCANDRELSDRVASHLGLFDAVYASN